MANRGRFQIPSIKEMEESRDAEPKIKRLFETHRHSVKEKDKDPSAEAGTSGATISKIARVGGGPTEGGQPGGGGGPSHPHKPPYTTVAPSTSHQKTTEKTNATESTAAALTKTSNSIIVSTRQKGNKILKSVRNVPWEFGDIIPDYVMGQTTCALYLSLRYHALHPNYIHERLKQLGHSYDLRVLLVQVDSKDPQFALKQLAKMCILADCTLIVAWTPEEAGRYLETFKSFENKPPDLIMEKTDSDFLSRLSDTVTTVKKVNKTDAMTLLSAFGSFQKAVEATEEDLSLCPGFGPQKAKRLHSVFHESFKKTKKLHTTSESASPVKTTPKKKGTEQS